MLGQGLPGNQLKHFRKFCSFTPTPVGLILSLWQSDLSRSAVGRLLPRWLRTWSNGP